jgi:hypothetical protein
MQALADRILTTTRKKRFRTRPLFGPFRAIIRTAEKLSRAFATKEFKEEMMSCAITS